MNTKAAALASESRFINLAEQALYHSINDAKFGPDGYLYVSFGDEGEQGEPYLNAQSITRDQYRRSSASTWSASRATSSRTRTIPSRRMVALHASDPLGQPVRWAGSSLQRRGDRTCGSLEGSHGDLATGFRNPFKFHIDQQTGDLWVGDVGMDLWEEVSVIQKGDNAGWSFWEGKHERTNIAHRKPVAQHKEPIFEYPHANGNNSVTGGLLYRGDAYPVLKDKYVFGDFGSSRIWSLAPGATPGAAPVVAELPSGGLSGIVAFEVDRQTDQILLLQHTSNGKVMRLIEAPPSNDPFPQLLSEAGAFADMATLEPILVSSPTCPT